MAVTKSSLAIISLASFLAPTLAVPTRTNCRCIAIDSNQPWTELPSVRSSLSRQPDRCSYLAAELEYWQAAEPEFYDSEIQHWMEQKPTPTSAVEELKPLSTTELMALSKKKYAALNDDAPLPSAPTQHPRKKIICRPAVEEVVEYRDSETTLFGLTAIVIIAFLAFVAEAINLLIGWFERKQERRNLVQLPGNEKTLHAFSVPEDQSKKQKCYVYQVEYCDDNADDEYEPVL